MGASLYFVCVYICSGSKGAGKQFHFSLLLFLFSSVGISVCVFCVRFVLARCKCRCKFNSLREIGKILHTQHRVFTVISRPKCWQHQLISGCRSKLMLIRMFAARAPQNHLKFGKDYVITSHIICVQWPLSTGVSTLYTHRTQCRVQSNVSTAMMRACMSYAAFSRCGIITRHRSKLIFAYLIISICIYSVDAD